jgi:hypothetical protein
MPTATGAKGPDLAELFIRYHEQEKTRWPGRVPDYARAARCLLDFDDPPPAAQPEPSLTIGMPAAILHEPIVGIRHSLQVIHRDLQASPIGPTELLLWGNVKLRPIMKRDDGTIPESEAQKVRENHDIVDAARERLDHIQWEIGRAAFNPSIMQVRPALSFLTNLYPTLSEIRHDKMLAIAYDAVVRGLPADHPVLWFDADTTATKRGSIGIMVRALKERQARYMKGTMLFTGDPFDRIPIHLRDDHEKVACAYALARRMLQRELTELEHRGYVDECGFGFLLGSYLEDDGIDAHPPHTRHPHRGETYTLLERSFKKRPIENTIPLIRYLRAARHGTSYRRIHMQAKLGKVAQIPRGEDNVGYATFIEAAPIKQRSIRYKLFSDTKVGPEQERTTPVRNEEVTAMVDLMAQRQATAAGRDVFTPRLQSRMAAVIGQLSFSGGGPIVFSAH